MGFYFKKKLYSSFLQWNDCKDDGVDLKHCTLVRPNETFTSVPRRNSNIMDLYHADLFAKEPHKNVKKIKQRKDMSKDFKAVNPLMVLSAVLGIQTTKFNMGKFIT